MKLIIALALTFSVASLTAKAEGSVHHSGQASKHSILAAGHGALSSAKVASAVVAAPIISAGSTLAVSGSASVQAGVSIADTTSHHHHGPLIITEKVITADPAPDRVITIQKKAR